MTKRDREENWRGGGRGQKKRKKIKEIVRERKKDVRKAGRGRGKEIETNTEGK